MARSDALTRLVHMLVGFAIWFTFLIIARVGVLNAHVVRRLGFVVYPFQTELYPLGLPGVELISVAFLTIIIFSLLYLGTRLREELPGVFPHLPQIGELGYWAAVLISLIVAFFTYEYLIATPLKSQGVGWIYNLAFFLALFGILIVMVFHLVRMVRTRGGEFVYPIRSIKERSDYMHPSTKQCEQCGAVIDPGDNYCHQCGARIGENEGKKKAG